jgi:hypothetical protein
MKTSIWHLSLVLLFCIGLASTFPTRAYGQDTQSAPSEATSPDRAGSAQDSPTQPVIPTVPERTIYRAFFSHVANDDKTATKLESEGKNVDGFRAHDQETSGLTVDEGAIVKSVALDCIQALDEMKAARHADAETRSAQSANGSKAAVSRSEMAKARADSDDVVDVHIAQLRQMLGDASFAKLDKYVRSLIQPKGVNVAKPAQRPLFDPNAAPELNIPFTLKQNGGVH